MAADLRKSEFVPFEDLDRSGVLDSLYESLTLKKTAAQHYQSLHPVIKGRVRALRRIQYETLKLEVQFYKELAKLENRFSEKFQQLFCQRRSIVSGEHEPSQEEMNFFLNEKEEADSSISYMKSSSEGDGTIDSPNHDFQKIAAKGIPGFWLTVLKHAPLICEIIRPADLPALKHLTDIRSVPIDANGKLGFQLEFEFEPNEYFTNKILTKRYYLGYELRDDSPLSYDGPEVIESEGCEIDWKPDRNLTMAVSSKMHQNGSSEEKEVVTRATSTESFFQFFDPPPPSNAPKGTNPIHEQTLLEDYDIGQYLKERVIPRAVTYFTGEVLDLDNEIDNDDEFQDDELDDESDEEDEDGEEP